MPSLVCPENNGGGSYSPRVTSKTAGDGCLLPMCHVKRGGEGITLSMSCRKWQGRELPSPVALRTPWEGHALPCLRQKQWGRVVPSCVASKDEGG